MYTPDEWKIIGGLIMFSLIGRLLFYREKHSRATFKEKVKVRFVSWLWEIPVLLVFGFMGLALMKRFQLNFTEAGLAASFLSYLGVETVKIFIYDWINARYNLKKTEDKDGN